MVQIRVPKLLPVWSNDCTLWVMDTHNLSSLLGADSWSQNKKCLWHCKESYGSPGGRSESGITRMQTTGISTHMLLKGRKVCGIISRTQTEGKKKTGPCQNKGKEQMSVQFAAKQSQTANCSFSISSNFLTCRTRLIVNQNMAPLITRLCLREEESCFCTEVCWRIVTAGFPYSSVYI